MVLLLPFETLIGLPSSWPTIVRLLGLTFLDMLSVVCCYEVLVRLLCLIPSKSDYEFLQYCTDKLKKRGGPDDKLAMLDAKLSF
mmetsp:Transcript_32333/g.78620  ORF Transcript_32333/g.78620 Transcript_32333/m.78620 type:complete len:84 (+) Transcript_32333:772-1023(+)